MIYLISETILNLWIKLENISCASINREKIFIFLQKYNKNNDNILFALCNCCDFKKYEKNKVVAWNWLEMSSSPKE